MRSFDNACEEAATLDDQQHAAAREHESGQREPALDRLRRTGPYRLPCGAVDGRGHAGGGDSCDNPGVAADTIASLLVQAHGWWKKLLVSELEVGALAKRDGISGSYLTRVLQLVFFSPDLTQALFNGRQGKLDRGT